MKDFIIAFLLSVLVVGLMICGWAVSANTPVVKVSHTTGQCVEVIGGGSCNKLPERYEHVWVM